MNFRGQLPMGLIRYVYIFNAKDIYLMGTYRLLRDFKRTCTRVRISKGQDRGPNGRFVFARFTKWQVRAIIPNRFFFRRFNLANRLPNVKIFWRYGGQLGHMTTTFRVGSINVRLRWNSRRAVCEDLQWQGSRNSVSVFCFYQR